MNLEHHPTGGFRKGTPACIPTFPEHQHDDGSFQLAQALLADVTQTPQDLHQSQWGCSQGRKLKIHLLGRILQISCDCDSDPYSGKWFSWDTRPAQHPTRAAKKFQGRAVAASSEASNMVELSSEPWSYPGVVPTDVQFNPETCEVFNDLKAAG